MNAAVEDAVSAIVARILEEASFGDVQAKSVHVEEAIGPDDRPYVHLTVTAADPDPELGTWSREGVFALRSRVDELAAHSDVELPSLMVDVHPETPDEPEEPDDEQAADLAARLDDPRT